MNERTLLSFIIYGIRKDNIRNFPLVFIHGVEQLLTIEGFDDFIIDRVLEEYSQMNLTKTNNKSLLGNMNDLVHLYTDYVLHEGRFKHADLPDIIHKINRAPQRNLVRRNSIEAAREILNKASH
ncbi:MAG: hypothetical protein L0Z73_09580 [Gammaproteobacteria bacterium]|nr:hypothetical protein [Gammaproteobacteria bacterium]